MLLTVFLTSCEDTQTELPPETTVDTQPEPQDTEGPVNDMENYDPDKETKYIHKAILVNGEKYYFVNVINENTPAERNAAAQLKKYLGEMNISESDNGYPITLKIDPSLGEDAYRIVISRSNSEGMTISGGNDRGILYGVFNFLEKWAGMRFFTPTLETCYEGDISLVPDTYDFSPVLYLRQIDGFSVQKEYQWCVKNGVNCSEWIGEFKPEWGGSLGYNGYWVHTFYKLLGTPKTEQPCLTDPTVLKKTIAAVRKVLESNPDTTLLSVSQNDNSNYYKHKTKYVYTASI
jgi:hypothetical protein